MPFFSVIIPVYNRCRPVRRAIRSVLGQEFRDYDLTVVDDGSTDETPLIGHEFGKVMRYIRQENSGVSRARNRGVEATDSAAVAFLDSDDEWLPGKLARQHRFMTENPECGVHQTGEIWVRRGKRVNPMRKHLKRGGMIFRDSLELCLVSPSAVVLRRDIFERYGLFDENLPVCEDYDLWLRISCREPVGLVDEGLVI